VAKTLGQRIRELREQEDLSLRELAGKLGVSAAFLSDIELGRRFPSNINLAKIAQTLRTSFDELQTYDTRPPVDELKRLSAENPTYGVAFRRMINKKISPDDLLKFVDRRRKRTE
jgi:transcriptional regulator with XRE-family HTH domain